MLLAACGETIAVGRAKGVDLGDGLMGEILQMVRDLPHHTKASMLEDLERGKRLELPWLSGAVVRLAARPVFATPIQQFIAAVLKPHVNGGDLHSHKREATKTRSHEKILSGKSDFVHS